MSRSGRVAVLVALISAFVLCVVGLAHADADPPAPGWTMGAGDDSLSTEPWMDSGEDSLSPRIWIGSGEDSLSWEPSFAAPWAESEADSSDVRYVDAEPEAPPIEETSGVVVRYGAGGTFLPGDTTWERYPNIGISVTSRGSRPGWYFHTGFSALSLRETKRAEHLLWMIDGGLAMKWSEGRGFVGVGVSLRFAGSFIAEAKDEEEDDDEEEDEGGTWWWPIKDLEEFAAFPQLYVRIPLAGDLTLEASYVVVREKRPLVGGLDVMLMFYFPK